jgi:precorrin-2/cobalt-factor-2 C20-methyltransferase
MYVHEIIANRGFETEIIPGVTSYAAAAAALGVALCEGSEALTIIPASHGGNIDELIANSGNKVLMKSGKNLETVLQKLKERGYGSRTKIAFRAAMDGQRLYGSIEEYEKSPEAGYFTLAIVKEKE